MSIVALDGTVDLGRDRLGGKAFGITRMRSLGIQVPPAFCITTDECARFHELGGIPDDVLTGLPDAIAALESATGSTFGRGPQPLLVSVRSGAPTSMPGMMDTVLNLGITPGVEDALARRTGDARFAEDVAARFHKQYADIVGTEAPGDPWAQLLGAIGAVFTSWMSPRAITYRRERRVPDGIGTAVTVQAMVFGNLDDHSGTGVLFSRNPITGDAAPYGEYLPRGQGEDVVSGSHDPLPLDALAEQHPAVHDQLLATARRLESEGRDVQDIEFTIQAGTLWILQTRAAKRTAAAAVRLAVALEAEGLITADEGLQRVTPEQIEVLLREHLDPEARAKARVLASGRPACPGFATGVLVTDVDDAEERALDGELIILGRPSTSPDDVHAMAVVAGIVTEVGGSTSHAAVVSREFDVPCVVGCGKGVVSDLAGRTVTLDATTGAIYDGAIATVVPVTEDTSDLAKLADWARERGATGTSLTAMLEQTRAVGAPQ